jgi:hypothetical protein
MSGGPPALTGREGPRTFEPPASTSPVHRFTGIGNIDQSLLARFGT